MIRLLPALLLAGCASGTWNVQTWGEDYAEQGIPTAEFADGCAVTFDTFAVAYPHIALHDQADAPVFALGASLLDLTVGVYDLGQHEVPAGNYPTVAYVIGPADDAPAGHVAGTLTCPTGAVTFDWTFDTTTTYRCAPPDLAVTAGGASHTELTVHVDHLFYDSLVNSDAALVGEPWIQADDNADGELTWAEMMQAPLAPTGLHTGDRTQVIDLAAYVQAQFGTVGHVDGEHHCDIL